MIELQHRGHKNGAIRCLKWSILSEIPATSRFVLYGFLGEKKESHPKQRWGKSAALKARVKRQNHVVV